LVSSGEFRKNLATPKVFSFRKLSMKLLVRPARLERATYGSGGRRSIQLNYGREWIPNITQFNELAIQGFGGYSVGEPPTCEIAK
jgi:hypothetical protein